MPRSASRRLSSSAKSVIACPGVREWWWWWWRCCLLSVHQDSTDSISTVRRPGASEAFESVQYIMTQVRFGWLIRSIHSWSANLMIFTAFAHMFSVLFLKAYRKPRELTWISGVILLFLVMGFGFSGYLLPWNTLAFFATKVGTEITGQVPLVGKPMMILL